MPASPLSADTDLISLTILVNGKEISSAYSVLSVEIDRKANRIAQAEVVLGLSPMESTGNTFKLSESDEFVPGTEIEIQAGYNLKTDPIFKGIITSQGLNIKGADQITLEIGCADKAIKMVSGRQNKYFKEKSDSNIMSEIVADHGLEKTVESTTGTHMLLVQYQATDWDFILTRAQANGMLVNTQDGKLMIQKPLSSGSADLVLTYGKDVFEFKASVDLSRQIADVTTYAWSDADQQLQEGRSQEPSFVQAGNLKGKKLASDLGSKSYQLYNAAPLPKDNLKEWANAHLVKSRLALLQGKVSFVGHVKPAINKVIELSGFGNRFDGQALITGVHHAIEMGAWVTTVWLGLDQEWFHETPNISMPPAGGLIPAIQGLHIGVVKQIHADPDGAYRVLVNVPTIDTAQQEIWARLAHPYATNGQGWFFYPEVNDELVLGFLNNDPRFAVILGNLYSKKNKPPFETDEKNQFKGIVSKSEIKIVFDDVDKILSLITPGKQELTISDKDKSVTIKDMNGNTATLSQSGIALKSAKDLDISAQGNINIKANQKITVSASGGDVAIDGLNVKAQAKMSFEAMGAQASKLTSTAQVQIQGAMVMIN